MLYRIDLENYLLKMIDYFTREELLSCQYAIVSASIPDLHKMTNVSRVNEVFIDIDTLERYTETHDPAVLDQMYAELDERHYVDDEVSDFQNMIYGVFMKPLMCHMDVIIVCKRSENDYVDALVRAMKKHNLTVIDLNELFNKGHIGHISIDRQAVRKEYVDMNRYAMRAEKRALEVSEDGRAKLVSQMKTKEKIDKLRSLGISVNKRDLKNIDALLLEAWDNDMREKLGQPPRYVDGLTNSEKRALSKYGRV